MKSFVKKIADDPMTYVIVLIVVIAGMVCLTTGIFK